jgi:calcineurin-like phosphoesterase family protein
MRAGFDGVFHEVVVNHILYTHEPVFIYGGRVELNVHGHLHNLGYDHKDAFGGSYLALNDGKHVLYAPELQDYKPIEINELINNWRNSLSGNTTGPTEETPVCS